MKRKGFEWYKMLTKKQQKKFRKNAINIHPFGNRWLSFCLNDVRSVEDFINSVIPKYTPEGYEYWENIIKKLKNHK